MMGLWPPTPWCQNPIAGLSKFLDNPAVKMKPAKPKKERTTYQKNLPTTSYLSHIKKDPSTKKSKKNQTQKKQSKEKKEEKGEIKGKECDAPGREKEEKEKEEERKRKKKGDASGGNK
ncbi:Uncharacterized protein TCM_010852 [Theobroma cacao]|uniref:Uncharacterized protein n=1 Tax=Theobroma cacao TaxID=3641 RepID=A0A061E991_THECC|nr:Uncharacterized protein TCM_010852 [Theobroma cacao]